MATLNDILCAPENRSAVVRDAVQLVDDEVRSKGGISGLALKGGYKAVKAIKSGLVPEAVDNLLDRFVEQLEPFYEEWTGGDKSSSFESFISGQVGPVANALLGVTDARARTVDNRTIKKTYEKLRPQAEKHVRAAIPGFARLLGRFVKD